MAQWIVGSMEVEIKSLISVLPSDTHGVGRHMKYGLPTWRQFIRQAWLLRFLHRSMHQGGGERMAGNFIFNTYSITAEGRAFLESPHPVYLPRLKEPMHGRDTCS